MAIATPKKMNFINPQRAPPPITLTANMTVDGSTLARIIDDRIAQANELPVSASASNGVALLNGNGSGPYEQPRMTVARSLILADDGTVLGKVTFGLSSEVDSFDVGSSPLGGTPIGDGAGPGVGRGATTGHVGHNSLHHPRNLGSGHQHGTHAAPEKHGPTFRRGVTPRGSAPPEKPHTETLQDIHKAVEGHEPEKPKKIELGDVKSAVEGKTNLKGSAYLKASRQWIADELSGDPQLRRYLGGTIAHEQNPGPERQRVFESLANRLNMLREHGEPNLTLREYLSRTGRNQFYGPIRRGQITEGLQSQAQAQNVDRDIDAVLGGSNLVRGFTDQGSLGDPNYHRGEYIDTPGGESYNDFGNARAWREQQQRNVEQGGAIGSAPVGVESLQRNLPQGVNRLGTATPTNFPSHVVGKIGLVDPNYRNVAWWRPRRKSRKSYAPRTRYSRAAWLTNLCGRRRDNYESQSARNVPGRCCNIHPAR